MEMKNRICKHVLNCLVLVMLAAAVHVQAQRPENFYAHTTTVFEENGDFVEIMLGGFKTEEIVYSVQTGTGQYQTFKKYTVLERSPEVWKYNRRTHEWVQLKPYDETWTKVPPMAGHVALQNKLDGFMYCFGGRNANGDSSVYMYNIRSNQWRQLGVHKFYGHGQMAAAVDFSPSGPAGELTGTAVFHGGIDVHTGQISNELFVATLDKDGVTIENRGSTPRALYGHAALYDAEAEKVHFFGGSNQSGPQFDNYVYDLTAKSFGWGPPIQGAHIPSRSNAAFAQEGHSLFIWGGSGYLVLQKGAAPQGEEIRGDLCAITAKNGGLYGRVLANNLPPISQGALTVDITGSDTLFYVNGGISSIEANGDTIVDNSQYRYSLTQKAVQRFDTTTAQWTGLQTTVDEIVFPVSPELEVAVPVWPNPSDGVVAFTLREDMRVRSIKIYNQLGQLVLRLADPGQRRIDLSRQPAGL